MKNNFKAASSGKQTGGAKVRRSAGRTAARGSRNSKLSDSGKPRKPGSGRLGRFNKAEDRTGRKPAGQRTYREKSSRSFDKDRPLRNNSSVIKRRKSDIEAVRGQLEERPIFKAPQHARAQSYTPKPRKVKASGEEGVRLNRFIANSGICSRREADELISAGLVSVNGQVVTELGTKVFQNDEVRYDGSLIKGEQKVYIIMNKPKDFVTTTSDPHAEKTVMDLVAGKCKERVYPVGRLDRDTTGVLLLTNDGELTERLTHPSHKKKKIYHVFLDKNLKRSDFDKILKGIHLEDGVVQADSLSYIDEDETQVGLEIHSGQNRVVRRIFDSLGYKVKKLDRVYFAGLTKKGLRRGQWRFLSPKEVSTLFSVS